MLVLLAKRSPSRPREPWRGSLVLAGRAVDYTVRVSGRAKNLRLEVDAESGLQVVVPERFNAAGLEAVLRRKQGWILDKLDHFARLTESRRLLRRQGGGRVLYRGREHQVEIKTGTGPASVQADGEKLVVTVPGGAEGQAGAVLEQWLRRMARLVIKQRLEALSRRLNLAFHRVFIRDQKTRWGSCSRRKNLNFNWRLVMAPPPVLDYIVVHELMHLVEPNHSTRFWALVEEVCPDYKAHRAWIRKNGHNLTL
ncbi:MAG: M48 family metallopeptidase [Bacillota bacterium]